MAVRYHQRSQAYADVRENDEDKWRHVNHVKHLYHTVTTPQHLYVNHPHSKHPNMYLYVRHTHTMALDPKFFDRATRPFLKIDMRHGAYRHGNKYCWHDISHLCAAWDHFKIDMEIRKIVTIDIAFYQIRHGTLATPVKCPPIPPRSVGAGDRVRGMDRDAECQWYLPQGGDFSDLIKVMLDFEWLVRTYDC